MWFPTLCEDSSESYSITAPSSTSWLDNPCERLRRHGRARPRRPAVCFRCRSKSITSLWLLNHRGQEHADPEPSVHYCCLRKPHRKSGFYYLTVFVDFVHHGGRETCRMIQPFPPQPPPPPTFNSPARRGENIAVKYGRHDNHRARVYFCTPKKKTFDTSPSCFLAPGLFYTESCHRGFENLLNIQQIHPLFGNNSRRLGVFSRKEILIDRFHPKKCRKKKRLWVRFGLIRTHGWESELSGRMKEEHFCFLFFLFLSHSSSTRSVCSSCCLTHTHTHAAPNHTSNVVSNCERTALVLGRNNFPLCGRALRNNEDWVKEQHMDDNQLCCRCNLRVMSCKLQYTGAISSDASRGTSVAPHLISHKFSLLMESIFAQNSLDF